MAERAKDGQLENDDIVFLDFVVVIVCICK